MLSYKEFKKGYLTEWVDRSQAARKEAEELANKDTTSLRDKYAYKDINQDLVFTLAGHKVEFKGENEENPKDKKYNFFTWDEAIERFGEPDKDGWRLLTKEEYEDLLSYPKGYDDNGSCYMIDGRLSLPSAGVRNVHGIVEGVGWMGYYWTSSSYTDVVRAAWLVSFIRSEGISLENYPVTEGCSVRLVREVH